MPAPEVFNFPYHTQETEYPESSVVVEFGNNWDFVSKPTAPDLRTFTLYFPTMIYVLDDAGQIDLTVQPEINFAVLEDFYARHRLYKTFTYPHPVYGDLPARFKKPLKVPKGHKDGQGALQSFQVQLIERPLP